MLRYASTIATSALLGLTVSACGSSSTDGANDLASKMGAICDEFASAQNAADAGDTDTLFDRLDRLGSAVDRARASGASEADAIGGLVSDWVEAASNGDSVTAQLNAAGIEYACEGW
jgi:hypothetical protein